MWIILAAFAAATLGFRKGLRQGYNLGRAEAFYSHTVRERISSLLAEPVKRRAPYLPDPNHSPQAAPRPTIVAPKLFPAIAPQPSRSRSSRPRSATGRIAVIGLLAAVLGAFLGFGLLRTVRTTPAPRPAAETPEDAVDAPAPEDNARTQEDLDRIVKTYGK